MKISSLIFCSLFSLFFGGCTLFFDTSLPDFTCCDAECFPDGGDVGACGDAELDTDVDAGDTGDTSPPHDADTWNWPDSGRDTEVTDTPTDSDTPDAPDGEDGTNDSGEDTSDTPEVIDWEVDTGGDVRYYYVANYHPRDRDRIATLNVGVRPEVEVYVSGTGWVSLATTNEPFAGEGLSGSPWRITVPNQIGKVGCTEYTLPTCLEEVCEVQVPPHSTTDLESMIITEGDDTRFVHAEYQCIYDLVDELPTSPELFCPNTTTVLRISEEAGIRDLFCVEPLYLEDVSNDVLTQCRDQSTGENHYESCGLTARSFVTDFPTWMVQQTIRVGELNITREFEFQR